MDIDHLLRDRAERDRFLVTHYSSPLPEEHRENFRGLDYFPPDSRWEIECGYESTTPHSVPLPSTSGRENPYTKIGVVALTIEGTAYELMVLDDGDGGVFIPFRDGTSGVETYGGGRYVDVVSVSDASAIVDFNTARNPWCVYDEEFICPLPPTENWITQRIPAGEKMYRDG